MVPPFVGVALPERADLRLLCATLLIGVARRQNMMRFGRHHAGFDAKFVNAERGGHLSGHLDLVPIPRKGQVPPV
jgi:hypothetical protein